ncbi:MAG: serine/threonine-protein kinase, partial [Planctomycetota bacterium]
MLDELGRGGMGAVYRGRHVETGRLVALKVMTGFAGDEDVARFLREAAALAALEQTNVVRVLESGRAGERPFIALELLEGGSLAARIKSAGRLSWQDTARLGAELARGLAAIHAAGFIHRDLKPANVLFDRAGTPKITDLGLAKPLDAATRLTASSVVVGTPAYLSPEQADGRAVDARADLYALGCVLHAALTGEPPFAGTALELLHKHMSSAPRPLRGSVASVPVELARIVDGLLAKSPGARGGPASAVAERLASIGESEGRSARRKTGLLATGAVLLALALAAAVVGGERVLAARRRGEAAAIVSRTRATLRRDERPSR